MLVSLRFIKLKNNWTINSKNTPEATETWTELYRSAILYAVSYTPAVRYGLVIL